MATILLMLLSVILGFFLGSYWVLSGQNTVLSRQQYNKIVLAAGTWWTTLVHWVKNKQKS
jgi:hypothetical protein